MKVEMAGQLGGALLPESDELRADATVRFPMREIDRDGEGVGGVRRCRGNIVHICWMADLSLHL